MRLRLRILGLLLGYYSAITVAIFGTWFSVAAWLRGTHPRSELVSRGVVTILVERYGPGLVSAWAAGAALLAVAITDALWMPVTVLPARPLPRVITTVFHALGFLSLVVSVFMLSGYFLYAPFSPFWRQQILDDPTGEASVFLFFCAVGAIGLLLRRPRNAT